MNDVHCILLSSPAAHRAALTDEAKAMYSSFIGGAVDSQKILDFVSARLSAKPEESDVVVV